MSSDGKKTVVLYGLSTCVWCNRTKRFLEKHKVAFTFVLVDTLQGKRREQALAQVKKFNPRVSFPTLVVDKKHSIVGYHENQMKEVLGL
jgi:glutaredoxin